MCAGIQSLQKLSNYGPYFQTRTELFGRDFYLKRILKKKNFMCGFFFFFFACRSQRRMSYPLELETHTVTNLPGGKESKPDPLLDQAAFFNHRALSRPC